MLLKFVLNADGSRSYTLKDCIGNTPAVSAHPARFSPDDKYSAQRVAVKRRFGILMTQQKLVK
jgi:H/ACA ribonucleoprotein complex subunit 3